MLRFVIRISSQLGLRTYLKQHFRRCMTTADCVQMALMNIVLVYKAPISNSTAEKQHLSLSTHFKAISFYSELRLVRGLQVSDTTF